MQKTTVRNFRQRLRIIEREIIDQLKSETTCCGVSLPQCHAILEIGDLGRTTISNLAKILRLDKSTLSRTIDGLVKINLVERVINPRDRRYMEVALTESGNDVLNSINELCDAFYSKLLDKIPPAKVDHVMEAVSLVVDAFIQSRDIPFECVPGVCSEPQKEKIS